LGFKPSRVKIVEEEVEELSRFILIILGIDSKTTFTSSVLLREILRYWLSLISKKVPIPSILPIIASSLLAKLNVPKNNDPILIKIIVIDLVFIFIFISRISN